MNWYCVEFDELSKQDIYAIMRARQEVFVVEQGIRYVDADALDYLCRHVFCKDLTGICAYARIIPADASSTGHVSFGRLLTSARVRGRGIGKALVEYTISSIRSYYPEAKTVRIAAQHYLSKFYQGYGFVEVSKPYVHAEVLHVDMQLFLA